MNQDNHSDDDFEKNYKSFADELDKGGQIPPSPPVKAPEKPAGPDIATKAELDRLKTERNKPVPTLDCTIGGTVEQKVHTQLQKENEKRMGHLEERLGRMQGKPKEAFELNQLYADKENERKR